MNPKNLLISDFTYNLPDENVAKYPLDKRDESNLLVYHNGKISDSKYRELAEYLPSNSLLVFNNTKVVEARILFQKSTGATIEIFCLEPHEKYSDITIAMQQTGKVWWKCLVGGAGKWKKGTLLEKFISDRGFYIELTAALIEKQHDCFIVELNWQPATLSFAEVLHYSGIIPLPPYLHRLPEETDKERYQTIYAENNGSVAAPTAGLHFTNHIFSQLQDKGIESTYVTLHVGAGTFKPVKSEHIGDHDMHAEFIDVPANAITTLANNLHKKIVAVGTTSLRTIESLYWMGNKIFHATNPSLLTTEDLILHQWEAYEMDNTLSPQEALKALQEWMQQKQMNRLITKTQIIIAPGYDLKIASGLITNFHQPQSTLLLLIAAIVGDQWKQIYDHALANNYRFLSYGDGSLLWKNGE